MAENHHEHDRTQSYTPLPKGTAISHYRIVRLIGVGGMGEVYQAEDTKLNRTVALKFLPHYLVADEDAKARFKREAQAAAGLKHPNIVTIHEVGEYESRPFFVMEHCEGQSLRDLLAEKTLSVDLIVDFAIQICEGLHEAHAAGVIHRDVKPSNIVIDKNGRPKLVDFGLAAVRGMEKLTKTGSTLGTVGYMSPEQIEVKDVDHRSDLFSFGVLLYEMITGRTPFPGETEAAVIKAVLGTQPEPLARYKSDVPDELQRIVAKLLEKNPEMRYQSAAGILPDLKRLRQIRESGVSFVTGEADVPASRKKLWRILVPTSALVLIILLVLILKPWKFEITPTQEAAAEENRLAIMYFDNLVDPQDSLRLGEIAANLLITDLSESHYLDVVSSQRLYDILKLLGREGEKKIDRDVATEVAKKARSRWMLLGSILQVEPQIIITAQLVDVETGSAIASQRITGEADDNIFTLVDRLTVEIKNDLSLPAAALEEPDRPIRDVTTDSPEAYRYLLEGLEYCYKYYWTEADLCFRKALELDSTCAMGYYGLSWTTLGSEQNAMITKAMEYSEKATQEEKHTIRARQAWITHDYRRAAEEFRKIVERHPENKTALFFLATVYSNYLKQYDEAVRHLNKVIDIDSLFKAAYNLLAYTYERIGDLEKSIWAINKYISLAPNEANPYDSRGDLYAFNGKIDQAIESYQKAIEIMPGFSLDRLGHMYLFKREYGKADSCYRELSSSSEKSDRSKGRTLLALVPIYQGKFAEALRILEDGIAADRMENFFGRQRSHKHRLRALVYKELNNLDLSLKDAASCDAYPSFYASILAMTGNFAEAERINETLKKNIEEKNLSAQMYEYWLASGIIEGEKGDIQAAIRCLENAVNEAPNPYFHVRSVLAHAYLNAGKLGKAVTEFEKAIVRYDESRAYVPIYAVKVHYQLGLAYQASGWTDKAIEQYQIFLDIWKDADPGIVEIDDAKQRLVRLKSES